MAPNSRFAGEVGLRPDAEDSARGLRRRRFISPTNIGAEERRAGRAAGAMPAEKLGNPRLRLA